jgi:hypothetical protein
VLGEERLAERHARRQVFEDVRELTLGAGGIEPRLVAATVG